MLISDSPYRAIIQIDEEAKTGFYSKNPTYVEKYLTSFCPYTDKRNR